jgi:predicted CXXCH cytochrome family protein
MRIIRIVLAFTTLLALLLIAASAYGLPQLADEAPAIPHPIPGRLDCLGCHGAAEDFAEEHQGQTNETCTTCHSVGDNTGIPAVLHPIQGQEKCLACHAAGKMKPFPADHPFQTEQVCLNCHPAKAVTIPAIPHPLAGRDDCLVCHGPGGVKPFPADHQGRTNEMCTVCHQVSATAAASTPQATAAAAIPTIPHPIAGREDCLVCHGPGGVKPFPADHEGRTSDTCLGCHEVAAAVVPEVTPEATATLPPSVQVVPTPIQEPELFGENTCVSCHQGLGGAFAQITADWSASVHSTQGVGCVSCHGGDPTKADAAEAMSPEAGFLGVPAKDRIPGLCGSCHTNVDLMRPFNLPTDQLDQYWQSQHGEALLAGDQNVATCFDCHDGHRVLKTSDPTSQVYPTNEPAMCARCHADEALMGQYGIPTDQYKLYQSSVHGMAVLQNQDLRAPTCSTCHGKHGAAPPGLQQVANVCGQCHAQTEEYYLQGAHKTGMTGSGAPACITCHGQHDVAVPTLDLFLGTDERHCGICHAPGSATAGQVDAIYQALKGADDAYAQSEATITQAEEKRLIMADEKALLQEANTPLIESQALQHTVNLEQITAKTDESVSLSQQAQASAEEALAGLDTRRVLLIVALAVILVAIVALVLVKRELDRNLEARRARQRKSPS